MSLNQKVETRVRVRHNTTFDPTLVKGELGIGARHHYDLFMGKPRHLSRLKGPSMGLGLDRRHGRGEVPKR